MDELVKRLREVADEVDNDYDVDPYNAEQRCLAILEAADAIEELCKQLDAKPVDADKFVDAIIKSYEQNRWIPVTERLPEKYVNVLVFLHSLDWNSIYYSIDHLMEDGQWWKASTSWKHEVTHWMPLPEPPTAEEET